MKKITVEVTVKMLIHTDEDASLETVMDELDYEFSDTTGMATVQDTEITGYKVGDSR